MTHSSSTPATRAGRRLVAATVAAAALLGTASLTVPAYAESGAPGDTFRFPTFIGGAHGGIRLSNAGATAEPGEPSHAKTPTGAPDKPDHSIWFDWVAPTTGRVVFRTKDSEIDTVMAAYEGKTVDALKQLASNDDTEFTHPISHTRSQIAFTAHQGTRYHIAIDSFTGEQSPDDVQQGRTRLSWDANDDFAVPIALPVDSTKTLLTFGNTDGATRQNGEPVHVPSRANPTGSIWYSWKAPKNGKVKFNVNISDFDAGAAAYTGTSLTTLKQVGHALKGDPTTKGAMTFTAKAGTTYLIAVASAGSGEEGEAALQYGFV